ncbi:hypothetical protein KBC79_03800 [Candidatus Woesebacteria bacterium]|nr:hypothetical protein [Candidatus Woesebacteria bacterium]
MTESDNHFQPERYTSVPENNLIERVLSGLYYQTATVTHESKLREAPVSDQPQTEAKSGESSSSTPQERSLLTRRKRAELLQKIKSTTDLQEQKALLTEAHERDRLGKEFLARSTVTVELPGLGEQSAQFTILQPPESKKILNHPPVFLVPGIANDIDPVGGLAQELAYSGRTVIVIGYPDSTLGTITPAFAEAVADRKDFSLHSEFFRQAITKISSALKMESFDLWSHSAGGPISAGILQDNAFQERVQNAVFLSPAACVEQSFARFAWGAISEAVRGLKQFSELSKYSLVMPDKKQAAAPDRKSKDTVFGALLSAVRSEQKTWPSKLASAGKVIIWSGERDTLTHSAESNALPTNSESVHHIIEPTGTHLTALVSPEKVIAAVDQQLSLS